MKSLFFLIVALFCLLGVARGQQLGIIMDEGNALRFTVPAENDFVDEHIDHIVFLFRDDTVSSVTMYANDDIPDFFVREFLESSWKQKAFSFDLGFEADRLIFTRRYPEIPLPTIPFVGIRNTLGEHDEGKRYQVTSIWSYRDSTEYSYVLRDSKVLNRKPERSGGYRYPARYAGDIGEVSEGLAKEVAAAAIQAPFDSVLVFQAVVYRDDDPSTQGNFELQHLLYGEPSTFSTVVAEYLQNTFNEPPKWAPAVVFDRPANIRIKVYVRLAQDGSVTIKLPTRLGSLTGD